jgi:hypothetical protein
MKGTTDMSEANDHENHGNGAGSPVSDCSALPERDGFYWWREKPQNEWRMIHIVDLAPGGPPYLCAYDVEKMSFSGRTLSQWAQHEPFREWIAVHKPNAAPLATPTNTNQHD